MVTQMMNHQVYIVWKHEYDLGIPIIDEQHRGIVTTINSLYYAMQNKYGESILKPAIEMVNEYTHIHFKTEESFLEKCGFPDLEQHQELHEEIRIKLPRVGKESLWNRDAHQFMEFLKNWWLGHICEKDRIFRDFLLKK
jgi:hemerythrin